MCERENRENVKCHSQTVQRKRKERKTASVCVVCGVWAWVSWWLSDKLDDAVIVPFARFDCQCESVHKNREKQRKNNQNRSNNDEGCCMAFSVV